MYSAFAHWPEPLPSPWPPSPATWSLSQLLHCPPLSALISVRVRPSEPRALSPRVTDVVCGPSALTGRCLSLSTTRAGPRRPLQLHFLFISCATIPPTLPTVLQPHEPQAALEGSRFSCLPTYGTDEPASHPALGEQAPHLPRSPS